MIDEQDEWLIEAQRRFREESLPEDPIPKKPKNMLFKFHFKLTFEQITNFFKRLFG